MKGVYRIDWDKEVLTWRYWIIFFIAQIFVHRSEDWINGSFSMRLLVLAGILVGLLLGLLYYRAAHKWWTAERRAGLLKFLRDLVLLPLFIVTVTFLVDGGTILLNRHLGTNFSVPHYPLIWFMLRYAIYYFAIYVTFCLTVYLGFELSVRHPANPPINPAKIENG